MPAHIPSQKAPGPTSSSHLPQIRINFGKLSVILIFLLLPWIILGLLLLHTPGYSVSTTKATTTAESKNSVEFNCKPGPWGALHYLPIVITPPTEYLRDLADLEHTSPWSFPNTSMEQLKLLCEKATLSSEQTTRLLSLAAPAPQIKGYVVNPTAQLILPLSPQSRETLYGHLSCCNDNLDQVNSFRIPAGTFPQWLAALPVSDTTRDLIQRLHYRHGAFCFFADLPLVLPGISSSQEKIELLRGLTQQTSFLVRLQLDHDSDIEALAHYWGQGRRELNIQPLLESAANLPGKTEITIIHLLPPFARQRLNCYPSPTSTAVGVQDGDWSSANFFNEEPDPRFLDKNFLTTTLLNKYHPIFFDPMLGDVVLFFRDNIPIHSAVFIADDIVFTKNGNRAVWPWQFMHLQDVQDYFQSDTPLVIRFMRRNPLGTR